MKVEEHQAKQIQEIKNFRSVLTVESDRGCALFASSYLDKALSDLLYCSLIQDSKIESDLFEGNSPLSTFSSRIKLAYYLGKISAVEKRDLDLIRKIRNDFAHVATPISFDTTAIKNRCKELSFSYHEKSHRPRGHFTAACLGLLAQIHRQTLLCQAPEKKSDNAPTEEQKAAHRKKIAELLSEQSEK